MAEKEPAAEPPRLEEVNTSDGAAADKTKRLSNFTMSDYPQSDAFDPLEGSS
ncbi:hypothetical protein ACFV4K_29710 [Nocardia sp. NPDC059764]|uniref:hypothetical protein n=1 Tax=Nocardia sp. NPDC059764 TaxID=3346939 RepID=UPI0036657257